MLCKLHLQWRPYTYHKRSNVESTMSMIKAKFRDHVRSKTDVAMKNEVLCKVLCHNICRLIHAIHELGITPTFADTLPVEADQSKFSVDDALVPVLAPVDILAFAVRSKQKT